MLVPQGTWLQMLAGCPLMPAHSGAVLAWRGRHPPSILPGLHPGQVALREAVALLASQQVATIESVQRLPGCAAPAPSTIKSAALKT